MDRSNRHDVTKFPGVRSAELEGCAERKNRSLSHLIDGSVTKFLMSVNLAKSLLGLLNSGFVSNI